MTTAAPALPRSVIVSAGTAGTFVFTATEAEGNQGTPAPSTIDSNGKSFGLFAQSADASITITRGFAAPLSTPGRTFSLDFVTGLNNDGHGRGGAYDCGRPDRQLRVPRRHRRPLQRHVDRRRLCPRRLASGLYPDLCNDLFAHSHGRGCFPARARFRAQSPAFRCSRPTQAPPNLTTMPTSITCPWNIPEIHREPLRGRHRQPKDRTVD